MADPLNSSSGNSIRDSKILVNVDHALEDLLVVSYAFKSKLFQGILLDSTNRYLPCGYPSPEVVRWSPPRADAKETRPDGGDPPQTQTSDLSRPFYSLCNRFTYFQDVIFQKNIALTKSNKPAKAKVQKMTVRLRPRQVLCSKCRSICNENSENVHSSTDPKEKEKSEASNPKHLLTENSNDNQNVGIKSPRKVRTTLVPKLSRLEPDDINKSMNGSHRNDVEGGRVWPGMLDEDRQMVLRKKRSVGSMEDLWDETVFEEAAKKAKTTPIIKISFGSPGEGTVLKIPSKVQLSVSDGEEPGAKGSDAAKAFKKAMKKAKKEAKRKISPERDEEPPSAEPNYKKHRHRVKHKKRHKNSKEEETKDKCLKQKLSINLRRVCGGGPGEEESWSGESSRSSEALKDPEDTALTTEDIHSEYSLQPTFEPPSRSDQHLQHPSLNLPAQDQDASTCPQNLQRHQGLLEDPGVSVADVVIREQSQTPGEELESQSLPCMTSASLKSASALSRQKEILSGVTEEGTGIIQASSDSFQEMDSVVTPRVQVGDSLQKGERAVTGPENVLQESHSTGNISENLANLQDDPLNVIRSTSMEESGSAVTARVQSKSLEKVLRRLKESLLPLENADKELPASEVGADCTEKVKEISSTQAAVRSLNVVVSEQSDSPPPLVAEALQSTEDMPQVYFSEGLTQELQPLDPESEKVVGKDVIQHVVEPSDNEDPESKDSLRPSDDAPQISEDVLQNVPSELEDSLLGSISPLSVGDTTSVLISEDVLNPPALEPMELLPPEEEVLEPFSQDDVLDSVPDFPASSPSGAPQDVSSCQTEDGSVLTVGDIVWAKMHGFPWWPAKVVRLCESSNGTGGCDARVSWFGSATLSLMSTDQLSPFIQTFKARYNRERKSTGYREALRQATTEASSKEFDLPHPIAEIKELLAL